MANQFYGEALYERGDNLKRTFGPPAGIIFNGQAFARGRVEGAGSSVVETL
jgi:hypothetical protein